MIEENKTMANEWDMDIWNTFFNDADEAWQNRFEKPLEMTPEPPLEDVIDITVEKPVGTIVEHAGERWLVTASDYVTPGHAADLEDGWDATVSVGWHTILRRVKDKTLECVAELLASGEAKLVSSEAVKFPDEQYSAKLDDLAYDSRLGLYQKSKFPNWGQKGK